LEIIAIQRDALVDISQYIGTPFNMILLSFVMF